MSDGMGYIAAAGYDNGVVVGARWYTGTKMGKLVSSVQLATGEPVRCQTDGSLYLPRAKRRLASNLDEERTQRSGTRHSYVCTRQAYTIG